MATAPPYTSAPSFAGPTPPDRTQMTLEDHLAAALQILRSRPLTGDEMMSLRAFHEAEAQTIAELTGQGSTEQMQQEPGQAVEEPEYGGTNSDYGTSPDTSAMNTGF